MTFRGKYDGHVQMIGLRIYSYICDLSRGKESQPVYMQSVRLVKRPGPLRMVLTGQILYKLHAVH